MKNAKYFEALLLLFLALTSNKWMDWHEGVSYLQANDSVSYEIIAKAAPALPVSGPLYHHGQRIFIHYLVGSFSHFSGLDLGVTYGIASLVAALLVIWIALSLLTQLGLSRPLRFFLLAAFVLNPYVFRYYWIVPTMMADLVFVMGLGLALFGLLRVQFSWLLLGCVIAMLGRQNALLILPGIGAWLAVVPSWKSVAFPRRVFFFCLVFVAVTGLYKALGDFVLPFTGEMVHGPGVFVSFFTWLVGETFSWKILAEHFLRVILPYGYFLAITIGILLAAPHQWKKLFPAEFWASWLMVAGLVAQPLVLDPINAGQNQSRQGAIGIIAALLATAFVFRGRAALWPNKSLGFGLLLTVLLTSLHHMYTVIGPPSVGSFAALYLSASAAAGAFVFISIMILDRNYGKNAP